MQSQQIESILILLSKEIGIISSNINAALIPYLGRPKTECCRFYICLLFVCKKKTLVIQEA